MMICPKVETCKLEKHQPCFAPNHSIPHIKEGSCDSCSAYCPACIPVPSTPASVPLPPELLTDEFQSWLDGKCTCGMCPEGIAYAYHETNPDKWYGKSFLCLYHKTHGNEGMIYVPVKEAVKLLYIAKAQLLELKAQNNRKVWISELEAEISQAQSQARADQNKIGEWLRKWMMHTKNLNWADKADLNILISKLQKGNFEDTQEEADSQGKPPAGC
jgi:hypothetical protein